MKQGLILLAAMWCALLPRMLPAQAIHGLVVDSATGTAVGAGFVLLLGPDGKELARALADPDGRFTLTAPAAGTYRLRSERIGFKMATSPTITLAKGQVLEYHLAIAGAAVRLEEIVISGETRCRGRPQEGQTTAEVWDEARKALAAVAWVQRQQRLRVRHRMYERDLGQDSTIVSEQSRIRSGMATKVYAALSPENLATRGYIQRDGNGDLLFNGPDADVLFSDEFLRAHCFRLQATRDTGSNQIGLAFEPTSNKISDIRGVMWLDSKSAELRDVEFHYTGYAFPAETDVAGGRVDFLRLSNGGWIVSRFNIRMPLFSSSREQHAGSMSEVMRGGRSEMVFEVSGIKEVGGEVLDVAGLDGHALASFSAATLGGVVYDSTRSMALIGARVRLSGTPYEAVTGPGGEFHLEGLPEGEYTAEFSHPDFLSWGILRGPRVSLRRGQTIETTLAVPPAPRLLRTICPELKSDTLGVVAGVVRDSAKAMPVRDAVIQFSWSAYDQVNADIVSGRRMGVEVGSDSLGYYRACGLPPSVLIQARIMTAKDQVAPKELRVARGELHELNLNK